MTFVGAPFKREEIIEIVESYPEEAAANANAVGVEIHPDRKNWASPRTREVCALVEGLREPERFKLFSVLYDCRIGKLPRLDAFTNLEFLHLAGRKFRDYQAIPVLPSLKSLFLVAYKEPDLRRFYGIQLNYCRLIRGRVSEVRIDTDKALLQDCRELRWAEESRIRDLKLDCCNRFDLRCLPSVADLRRLYLYYSRTDPISLDFVAECHSLTELVVIGPSMRGVDLSPVASSQSLRDVHLASASTKMLVARPVSSASPIGISSWRGQPWRRPWSSSVATG